MREEALLHQQSSSLPLVCGLLTAHCDAALCCEVLNSTGLTGQSVPITTQVSEEKLNSAANHTANDTIIHIQS